MRAGLSTIQQTLTPEAASVLNHSIAEAGRRNHGQTTPLHVAATLLASPSGFLRQACIRSHPNSSHPLQCRALELCFSVALERLPTAQNTSPGVEPPISNALMAALKRAQAHQRRGCPEQQQQPLLAVKVELDQLIISILDDPSVSRVMREASFSSPAVKATIEQSLNSTSTTVNSGTIGIGFRPAPIPTPVPIPNRNLYLNPRLQQGSLGPPGQQRNEEVRRVIDILIRAKKRNPVLVGESEPEAVVKELLRKIGKGELGETPLNNAEVIPVGKELILNKSQIPIKIKELGALIETKIGGSNGGGVILDLGDLKWLVENPMNLGIPAAVGTQQHVVSEVGRLAVAEMGKLLVKFGDGSYNNRVWLVGTATCETYLRCQVYHPTMENDWDLQAVPIASRSPLPGMFPRLGNNGILRPLIEPLKSFPSATTPVTRPLSENLDPAGSITFCPQCSLGYEKELALLVAVDYDKSSSEKKSNSDSANKPSLPKWLQNAKLQSCDEQTKSKEQELFFKRKSQELQKRWNDTCLSLHPNYHQNLSTAALCNPNFLLGQPIQPKLQPSRTPGEALQLNSNGVEHPEGVCSPPGSPVKTDLVLGRAEIANENQTKLCGLDTDSFKKLLKGLMEQAWWQPEAASAVATTITRCKLGYGKRRGAGSKGDVWLLFTGPDRIGKRKMASVLAENYCGLSPIMICLGSRRGDVESDFNFRGKTALDRIAEAVRRNPFSVIVLEDIDEADMLIRGSIKKAMERGRLADSHGREISLGNVIFIVTGNWTSVEAKNMENQRNWRLRLTFGKKSSKRRASWLHDEERSMKERKEMRPGLSFDLNLRADAEADRTDGSHNSSDLTVEHEEEQALECRPLFSIASVPHELVNSADESIVFKPVDFKSVRAEIRSTITKSFSMVVDERFSMEVEDGVLEKIVGGLWNGEKSLEEWAQKVLVPNFQQLKARLPTNMQAFSGESMVVCLESDEDSDSDGLRDGDRLPVEITVAVGEVLVL